MIKLNYSLAGVKLILHLTVLILKLLHRLLELLYQIETVFHIQIVIQIILNYSNILLLKKQLLQPDLEILCIIQFMQVICMKNLNIYLLKIYQMLYIHIIRKLRLKLKKPMLKRILLMLSVLFVDNGILCFYIIVLYQVLELQLQMLELLLNQMLCFNLEDLVMLRYLQLLLLLQQKYLSDMYIMVLKLSRYNSSFLYHQVDLMLKQVLRIYFLYVVMDFILTEVLLIQKPENSFPANLDIIYNVKIAIMDGLNF